MIMGVKKISFSTKIDEDSVYFDALPKGTQELVKDLILEAAQDRDGPEGWKPDDEAIEEIECRSRDGFIPHSFNCGGLEYSNFTDLMGYWSGGYSVAHKGAAKEIERQIDYMFKLLRENTFEKFNEVLTAKNLKEDDCNYHTIQELVDKGDTELKNVLRYIEDNECEYLGVEDCSIMHSIRFMYHGTIDGVHYASVSAAVNTEGPYHRSHISWAPSVFCEGAKEVEIKWTNQRELKARLKKALANVCKAVF
jgi:hypothetical protein